MSAGSIRFDRSLEALIALILSTVLGQAGFFYLKHHFNFIDGTNGSLFVSMDRAMHFNLQTTLEAGILLVLALPEGKPLASSAGALLFTRLTLLILMLEAIVQFFQANSETRFPQRQGAANQLRHLFCGYTLTLSGIAMVVVLFPYANVGEIAAERYMMTPLFLAMLCATSEFGRYSDRFQVAVKALFLVAIASNVFNLYLTKPTPTGEHDRLVAFLKTHDLKEGYATYWHADVLTVLSNYRVRVYHIEDKRFEPSLFMSTQRFYCEETQAHFIFLDRSEREGFDLHSVIADAGAPSVMTFERFQVQVYDRPLRFKAFG